MQLSSTGWYNKFGQAYMDFQAVLCIEYLRLSLSVDHRKSGVFSELNNINFLKNINRNFGN